MREPVGYTSSDDTATTGLDPDGQTADGPPS